MAKQRNLAVRLASWILPLALIAAPVVYLGLREGSVRVTAIPVSRGDVEDTVAAISSGTVKPRLDAMIASEFMGKIISIPVEEGDRVKEGDLLVELNHAELDAQLALAEANLRVGGSRLEQVKLGANIYSDVASTQVSQSSAQLEQARSDFERAEALYERKAISQSDFDKARLALRVAEETAAAAKASQRENLVRDEEVQSAATTIEQLQAAVDAARAAQQKAFVRAPFDGIVAKRIVDEGEAVTMGMPLLRLVESEDRYVEAPFDEANASEIAIGQKVRLGLDAYADEEFLGEVTYISPVVTTNLDLSRTLDAKIRIVQGQERFVPGMSVDVTIIVDSHENVVRVPSESIIRQEYVYVVSDGRARRRPVEVGIGNWEFTEILSGLDETDLLVTSVSVSGLDDGVQVNVVEELSP